MSVGSNERAKQQKSIEHITHSERPIDSSNAVEIVSSLFHESKHSYTESEDRGNALEASNYPSALPYIRLVYTFCVAHLDLRWRNTRVRAAVRFALSYLLSGTFVFLCFHSIENLALEVDTNISRGVVATISYSILLLPERWS